MQLLYQPFLQQPVQMDLLHCRQVFTIRLQPPSWINMDAYLTSGPIVITPVSNVLVRWQQSQAFLFVLVQVHWSFPISTDNLKLDSI